MLIVILRLDQAKPEDTLNKYLYRTGVYKKTALNHTLPAFRSSVWSMNHVGINLEKNSRNYCNDLSTESEINMQ